MEFVDPARELKRSHFAPKLIGFRRREPGRDDRDLHSLLLKERDAERLVENPLQSRRWIRDRLSAFPAAQIWVNHVALNWTGPDNRDLNHEVIEGLRLNPGQHRHLRPALDLKDPDTVGLADHRISR